MHRLNYIENVQRTWRLPGCLLLLQRLEGNRGLPKASALSLWLHFQSKIRGRMQDLSHPALWEYRSQAQHSVCTGHWCRPSWCWPVCKSLC